MSARDEQPPDVPAWVVQACINRLIQPELRTPEQEAEISRARAWVAENGVASVATLLTVRLFGADVRVLAPPEPGDAPSAEERAAAATSPDPWTRYRVAPVLLAALEAAERDRDAALERELDAAARAEKRGNELVEALHRGALAERERDEALATARSVWGLARAAVQVYLEGASVTRLGAAMLPPRMSNALLVRLREQEIPDGR